MLNILDQIGQWIKDFLIECIVGNLSGLFDQVNDTVGDVAAQVGQTPQGWNGSVFSMVRSLSDNVIIPIAGIILTFVLCYELISMIIDRNNMHDVDTFMFFKWFFKAWVAVYIVTHTFDSAPGGARFQRVQVLNPPGSGKDIAESKGVHREVESEGSRMWGI